MIDGLNTRDVHSLRHAHWRLVKMSEDLPDHMTESEMADFARRTPDADLLTVTNFGRITLQHIRAKWPFDPKLATMGEMASMVGET